MFTFIFLQKNVFKIYITIVFISKLINIFKFLFLYNAIKQTYLLFLGLINYNKIQFKFNCFRFKKYFKQNFLISLINK